MAKPYTEVCDNLGEFVEDTYLNDRMKGTLDQNRNKCFHFLVLSMHF